jgi:hypothetical protein
MIADLGVITLQEGKTALILASAKGHDSVVCSLLETDMIDIDYQVEVSGMPTWTNHTQAWEVIFCGTWGLTSASRCPWQSPIMRLPVLGERSKVKAVNVRRPCSPPSMLWTCVVYS